MSLQDEIAANMELAKQKESEAEAAQEELAKFRERIRAGETTGDPIRDYSIISMGFVPQANAFQEKLRALEHRLAGMTGQFALMVETVHREAQLTGCVRTFGGIHEVDTLFILNGEHLVLNGKGWYERLLPIAKAVRYDPDRQAQIYPLNIADVNFMSAVSSLAGVHSQVSREVEFLIGDEDVHRWVSADPYGNRFRRIQSMADAIERPLQDIPVFAERVEKERAECLKGLHDACDARAKLRHKLETHPRHDQRYITEMGATIGDLRDTVQRIRHFLETAKTIGLTGPLIDELRAEYEPKTETNAAGGNHG